VIVTDPRGRISLLNPAGAALLNIAVADAIGKPAVSVIKLPELTRILLDPRGGTQTAEISIGEERVLFASVSEIEAQNERVTGRVCVLWDVTHYKRLDALKSEFVSTVSHDLRAPLTLMRGYATMLGIVGEMNEQQADFIRKILSSVDQMGRLVDNLLDLGRIEAGLGLELEQVQVQELIDDVVDAYLPQAANKQIRLTTKPAEGSSAIEVDPTLFRQAIANLVDNAVKYTPAGGTVTLTSEQVDGMQFVHVQDTGFGIAPADQARLFEKFYRARRSESVREKGLGLGLAIVKSIAEQHGGRVTFDSRLGTGSRFTLQVPIGPMSGRASRTGIRTRSSGDPG
jgi:signal transduction histidine kinase